MEWIALMSISTMCVCFIVLAKKQIEIHKLQDENRVLKWNITCLENDIFDYKHDLSRYQYKLEMEQRKNKITKQIPKGTTQAVKDAMIRSHPDNGGKQEDFIMYRRAYNILTGKEKL